MSFQHLSRTDSSLFTQPFAGNLCRRWEYKSKGEAIFRVFSSDMHRLYLFLWWRFIGIFRKLEISVDVEKLDLLWNGTF